MPDALETPAAALPVAAPEAPSAPDGMRAAIEAIGREDGTPEPSPAPKRSIPPQGPDGRFVKPAEKPVEKPVTKLEPSKADDEIDPSKLKTSELAKHYHKLKAEQKEWLKKQEEYENKLKAPQEWPEKKSYEEKLAEREKALEDHKKRVEEYERELQFTNFTKSQAYKDQYEKPLTQAYKAGQTKTAMLQIVERRDDAENVVQAARDATAADFDTIMRITDERTAIKKAVEMFGDGAAVVLQHRERVFEKNALLEEAVQEYQTKGTEREKVMREQREKQSKHVTDLIENFRQAAIEKYPAWFKPDESDPKGNELLASGQHLLDRVIKGGAPLKDGEKQMTDEEMAIAVAAVRNKAAAFDRVSYKASLLSKRVKELEKELAQYKSSTPGNGEGSGRQVTEAEESMRDKIGKLGIKR